MNEKENVVLDALLERIKNSEDASQASQFATAYSTLAQVGFNRKYVERDQKEKKASSLATT